jgi:hypothetical protein
MKSLWLSGIVLTAILLVSPAQAIQGNGKLDEAALTGANAVQAIDIANQWKWSRKDIKSYVTTREVVFEFPGGRLTKIPLPGDKMVVAVAPYSKETHPCKTHFFSSCQAELAGQAFSVKAIDQMGKVLVDEVMTARKNGFFELWLPRNHRISLEVKQGDLIAKGAIETFSDSKTCVTTFQFQQRG